MFGSDDPFGFKEIREGHRAREREFARLAAEPSQKIPVPGQRIVFAAGLLGHGFDWVRKEAVVREVGEVSYLVEFSNGLGDTQREWIHAALVTDVIASTPWPT